MLIPTLTTCAEGEVGVGSSHLSSGCYNKIPQMSGLNKRHLFLRVLEAGVNDQGNSVAGETPLAGLQMASLCSIFRRQDKKEREQVPSYEYLLMIPS